ncbi:isocitrate lyase/phosphoenolpyruvate mutase family protein [Novosphingobium sp. BL-8H]|uniref:isocitrate lyase/PEP mutase family protein n=1 Tax=Novosphingobium sp. BL-8H TaxID=3127640 RepID=UPI003756B9BB
MDQKARATGFAALHERSGQPLVLTNVWDAGSAKAVTEAGAEAIATSSWAIAASLGHADGELLTFDTLAVTVRQITATASAPVTVDFERGYAESSALAADNLDRLLEAGIVGINVEDGLPGTTACRPSADQSQRIAALRSRAEQRGIPLFINARTDLFLNSDSAAHPGFIAEAKDRARDYKAAGASGLFVPGLLDPELIADICGAVGLPVNIMVTDLQASLTPFAQSGVRRISRGPAPYLAAMSHLGRIAQT